MEQFVQFLQILLGITAIGLFIYALKKGFTSVSYTCDIHEKESHVISILSFWAFFSDRFQVKVDGTTLYSGRAHYFRLSGEQRLEIDGETARLRWRWSWLFGNPVYILLERDGRILAKYGSERVIRRLGLSPGDNDLPPQRIIQLRLIREVMSSESVKEFASDEFPIDNRFGSDAVTLEQEVSKTLSTSLTCEESELLRLGISAALVNVLKAQISQDLSRRLQFVVGETITKRHMLRFSVRAGDAVVYKVKWKTKLRAGSYLASIDGMDVNAPYQTSFGLTYELTSSRVEPLPA